VDSLASANFPELDFVFLSVCHDWSAGAHLLLLAPWATRLL